MSVEELRMYRVQCDVCKDSEIVVKAISRRDAIQQAMDHKWWWVDPAGGRGEELVWYVDPDDPYQRGYIACPVCGRNI